MSKKNQALIRMHLEEYLRETIEREKYVPEWYEVLAFCLGYYNLIDLDILAVVRELHREGLIR